MKSFLSCPESSLFLLELKIQNEFTTGTDRINLYIR